jgi:hypothetical protein
MMNLGIREAWGDDQIFFRCGCQMLIWRKPDSLGTFPVRVDCCDEPHLLGLVAHLRAERAVWQFPIELSVIYRERL